MYENLPIYRKAIEINVYIEEMVRAFSRYHKYAIGSELRAKAREIIYAIPKVFYTDNKKEALVALRDRVEELKILIYLSKELKVLKNFRQFEVLSKLARELARQAQGWLGSQNLLSQRG